MTETDRYFSPLKSNYAEKYEDQPRMEVVGLIETPPEKVLEIGCGAGATGLAVKQKFPGAMYVGVEIDEGAAARARACLDRVICGDIEKMDMNDFDLPRESFDLVICNDVLEHLYDPWKALNRLRDRLKPAGRLIASIPNVQNLGIILKLIGGNWTYTPYGLLDATHIRFFTLPEIQTMFHGGGFQIINCTSILQGRIDGDDWPRDLDYGKVLIRNVSKEEASMLFTFQYIIVAEKRET
jgi:SAM-dependent methyltransferase